MTTYEMYPRYALINDISQAAEAVITFDDEHDFTEGEILSLRVSKPYGMVELNNREVRVISTTTFTVTIDVDTRSFMPFILASDQREPAMAVPAASGVIPGQYVPTMNLEDAFDNRRA